MTKLEQLSFFYDTTNSIPSISSYLQVQFLILLVWSPALQMWPGTLEQKCSHLDPWIVLWPSFKVCVIIFWHFPKISFHLLLLLELKFHFENDNPIQYQQFSFEKTCHFMSIVQIYVNLWCHCIFFALNHFAHIQVAEDVPENLLDKTVLFPSVEKPERQSEKQSMF